MKLGRLIGPAALLVAVLATGARADEFWVRAGSAGDGTAKGNPSGMIAPLLEGARRGDVIHVAQGEYNGKDQTGEFMVNVPDITLVGGYNSDFSERNPFKYPTILRRKAGVTTSYTKTEGGIICMNPDAHGDGQKVSSSGLIVDGFFIDGSTRNVYSPPGPRLAMQGSWKEPLIKVFASDFFTSADVRIRNCVLLNGYYQGIMVKWMGGLNEVTNCLLVNCSIAGIDASDAPPPVKGVPGVLAETRLVAKNNTVACFYNHDKAQQARGFYGGKVGTFHVEKNVFAILQGLGNEGVLASPKNTTILSNLFWYTADAEKIVRDQATAATGAGRGRDDEEEEEEEEEESGSGGGATGVSGNVNQDPGFNPDKGFLDAITAYGVKFGKWPDGPMREQRKKWGFQDIELSGSSPPELAAFMRPYPVDDWAAIPPAFVSSSNPDKGIQLAGPFESYGSRAVPSNLLGGVPGGKNDYEEISWDDLVGNAKAAQLDGKKVKLKAGINPRQEVWHLAGEGVTGIDYVAYELRKPGSSSENVSEKLNAYSLIGSSAGVRFNEVGNRGVRKATWADGVWVRGILRAKGTGKTPYSLVVDYMGKP